MFAVGCRMAAPFVQSADGAQQKFDILLKFVVAKLIFQTEDF